MHGLVDGKVALVTGAARGQGRAHAVRLAEQGADIIAVDICEDIQGVPYEGATKADLAETVRLVEGHGRRIVAHQLDVRDLAELQAGVDEGVAALGRLDVAVANAGIMGAMRPGWELSEQEWATTIGINLTGVWHTAKVAVPHMIEGGRGGSLILISSMAGLRGVANVADYSASKHALVGLARSLAKDAGRYAIRVNTVHPGSIPTKLLLHDTMYGIFRPDLENPTLDDCMRAFRSLNLLPGAFQEPEDVANAVLWLASDLSRATTGTTLTVDGGASYS
jgi:SDR family mycofactocin-dependent oxidoreductase